MELELAAGAAALYLLLRKKKPATVATNVEAPAVIVPTETKAPEMAIDYIPPVDPRCNVPALFRPGDCPPPVHTSPRNMTPIPIVVGINAQCFAPLEVIQKFR